MESKYEMDDEGIVLVRMKVPKDCPMCPAACYDKIGNFSGCGIVPGKKFAMSDDPEYANSSSRPAWCAIVGALPVDTAPVVYAEWVWDKDGMDWGIGSWKCSRCRARPETLWKTERSTSPYRFSGSHFCGNCGAKMRRGGMQAMKLFSDCGGECCVCSSGGFCLAGHGDDDFSPASKEKIIERLDKAGYPHDKDYMIQYLAKLGYHYDVSNYGKKRK